MTVPVKIEHENASQIDPFAQLLGVLSSKTMSQEPRVVIDVRENTE